MPESHFLLAEACLAPANVFQPPYILVFRCPARAGRKAALPSERKYLKTQPEGTFYESFPILELIFPVFGNSHKARILLKIRLVRRNSEATNSKDKKQTSGEELSVKKSFLRILVLSVMCLFDNSSFGNSTVHCDVPIPPTLCPPC